MSCMNSMNFFKGLGIGLMLGSMLGMATAPRRGFSKSRMGKCMHGLGDFFDNMADTIMHS